MIRQMAIAIALLGFNDLGCSVTPTFFFAETDFIYFFGVTDTVALFAKEAGFFQI